jgi:hypothetical protein
MNNTQITNINEVDETDEVKLFRFLKNKPLTAEEIEKERNYKPKCGWLLHRIKVRVKLFWMKFFSK